MLSLSLKMTMMLQRLAADPKTELKSLLVVRLLHNYGGVMLTLSLAKVQTATADARSAVDEVVDISDAVDAAARADAECRQRCRQCCLSGRSSHWAVAGIGQMAAAAA
jgi:hypothetical protein